jgi:3-oxoacyl-[acyl-carrier-protein] synthase III
LKESSIHISDISYYLGDNCIQTRELIKDDEKYNKFISRAGFWSTHKVNKNSDFDSFLIKQSKENKQKLAKIQMVLVCTSTPLSVSNYTIEKLLKYLNLSEETPNHFVIEACTGWSKLMVLANILREKYKNILVICYDMYSIIDPSKNMKTYTIFSDAISITYLETSKRRGGLRYIDSIEYSNFDLSKTLEINFDENNLLNIKMDGNNLLLAVLATVPKLTFDLVKSNNISIEQINNLYFHQGSKIVCQSLAEKLGLTSNFFFLEKEGNCTSSSIPLLIKKYEPLRRGLTLFITFGMGYKINISLWDYE